MRLATISTPGGPRAVLASRSGLVPFDQDPRTGRPPTVRGLISAGIDQITKFPCGEPLPYESATWLPPLGDPAHIFCIGLNYETHRMEGGRQRTDHPTVFLRAASSQVGHLAPLVKPRVSHQFDYEGELAAIIGRGGRHIPADRALEHVFGLSCYNDASVRDWQNHTSQWTPGKNFAGTGAFGPEIVTLDEIDDLSRVVLSTRINGIELQHAQVAEMTFPIPHLIEYVSTFCELRSGDVIVTGTPGGVGMRREPQVFLRPGDLVEVQVTGVGTLSNTVIAEAEVTDGNVAPPLSALSDLAG